MDPNRISSPDHLPEILIERRVVYPAQTLHLARRVKPSLTMTKQELQRLSDHDLLVLLHERIKVHADDHRKAIITFRWTVGIVLTVLLVVVGAASVLGSLGNP